ncbi:MAG: phosphonate ABC transporter, permease protein PhnE [Bdellovibrionota bacterium]
MIDIFQKKFDAEKRKAFWASFVLDTFLIFYFLFMFYFFTLSFSNDTEFATKNMDSNILRYFGLISAVVALAWGKLGRSPGVSLIYRTNGYLKSVVRDQEKKLWWQKPYLIFSVITMIGTLVLGVQITDASFRSLFSQEGLLGAQRIFSALLAPNWSIIGSVLSAMLETIFIALLATCLAIPFSFFASFFCARNLVKNSRFGTFAYFFLRTLFNFTRSVEPVIWAIIFSVWVGIGPFAGMLALMLHSMASLAKLYSEQIENIDNGPLEAMEATGGGKIHVIWHAVVPQVLMPFLSYTIYRWDINIRMATVIGIVGGGGVGALLFQYQGLAQWNEVGTIVIVIAAVVWVMDFLSGKIREALV